jgi:transmembrane sensor
MTNITDQQHIKRQAQLWVSRIEKGLSNTERQTFVAWLNNDRRHHTTFTRISPYWSTKNTLSEFNGLFPPKEQSELKQRKLQQKLTLAFYSLLFIIMISVIIYQKDAILPNHDSFIESHQLRTAIGEHTSFTLSDGSSVQLNTNSAVDIRFSQKHRQLVLIKGEALFTVAKDKKRPFTVYSGEQSFTALGTIFNVQKSQGVNELELIVTEGRVLIAEGDELLPQLSEKIAYNSNSTKTANVVVTVGQKAVISGNNKLPVETISQHQLYQTLAWKKGLLIFDGESLASALAEVSRYSQIEFSFSDPAIAQLKVAGYFKTGDVDSLLESLSYNFDIHYTKINSREVLISKNETS